MKQREFEFWREMRRHLLAIAALIQWHKMDPLRRDKEFRVKVVEVDGGVVGGTIRVVGDRLEEGTDEVVQEIIIDE